MIETPSLYQQILKVLLETVPGAKWEPYDRGLDLLHRVQTPHFYFHIMGGVRSKRTGLVWYTVTDADRRNRCEHFYVGARAMFLADPPYLLASTAEGVRKNVIHRIVEPMNARLGELAAKKQASDETDARIRSRLLRESFKREM